MRRGKSEAGTHVVMAETVMAAMVAPSGRAARDVREGGRAAEAEAEDSLEIFPDSLDWTDPRVRDWKIGTESQLGKIFDARMTPRASSSFALARRSDEIVT
jgi:hypothetical protein